MHNILERTCTNTILKRLQTNPAVALLGARQVGKTTIADMICRQFPRALYLDLERPADLNKLNDSEAFFNQFGNRLICLDEIQRTPDIFPILRGVIDRNRHNSQFLILGSASRDLIKQSSESLAGRISYIEITPFNHLEIEKARLKPEEHWLKGGYPRSLLARNLETSVQWREDYIRTFLERDIPLLGFHIPAATLGRFWRMLSHCHGQILNASKLADSMDVSSHTIKKYIDLLEQTFLVRVLAPYFGNIKKRLIKSPKVYIRDTGLLHTLLNIETMESLFAHPVYGASYEGFVIENILAQIQMSRWQAYYFRTSNGAEVDLILKKGDQTIAIEVKASTAPKLSKSFFNAIEMIKADQVLVVAPVDSAYPLNKDIMVTPLSQLFNLIAI